MQDPQRSFTRKKLLTRLWLQQKILVECDGLGKRNVKPCNSPLPGLLRLHGSRGEGRKEDKQAVHPKLITAVFQVWKEKFEK